MRLLDAQVRFCDQATGMPPALMVKIIGVGGSFTCASRRARQILHVGNDLSVTAQRGFSEPSLLDVSNRVRTFWVSRRKLVIAKFYCNLGFFTFALGISLGYGGFAHAHSGIVDGYGCHRGPDKVTYHCHQGQFVGRTFKSKDDFLRQLRGGKAEQLSPKNNPPRPEKKPED